MSRLRSRSIRTLLPLVAALGLSLLSGCAEHAGDSATGSDAGNGAFPVQLSPQDAPSITLDKRPDRIVSLSPSTTETLYAVGAGNQVVAVDDASDYPAEAPRSELSGINTDPEAISSKNPDLVIVTADQDNKLATALEKTGTKTLVLPAPKDLEQAYEQFALVGKATGHQAEGDSLAQQTKDDIDKIVADTPKPPKPLSYYHELDPSYYTVTSATFIGKVYSLFGLTNIADGTDPNAAAGYPQLSPERVLQGNPDLIFVGSGENAETVSKRPGFATLNAIKDGHVIEFNDTVTSRWSPRIVDFVRSVSDAVSKVDT